MVLVLRITIALTGGMGVETLGYKLFHGNSESVWYKVEVTIEEFMEMLGATLVLVSALNLRRHKAALSVLEFRRVGDSPFQLSSADQKVG